MTRILGSEYLQPTQLQVKFFIFRNIFRKRIKNAISWIQTVLFNLITEKNGQKFEK